MNSGEELKCPDCGENTLEITVDPNDSAKKKAICYNCGYGYHLSEFKLIPEILEMFNRERNERNKNS